MRLKHQEIVERLEKIGLHFKIYSVFSEGEYSPEDGIWNYKDALLHIPQIHKAVQNVPVHNHTDSLANVFIQKIFGFRFPMIVYDFEAAPLTQTTISSLFFFILVIHNACEEVRPGITRVTTTYHIGTSKWFSWFLPLVGWVLLRNYKRLSNADIPLRTRRGALRKWGYDFRKSDYVSVEKTSSNVLVSEKRPCPKPSEIDLLSMKENTPVFFGETDHFGVRLYRSHSTVWVHPRMCFHEGAVLDNARRKEDCLACPWHGLSIAPLARIDLSDTQERSYRSSYHQFVVKKGLLTITPQVSK